jgi:hypothetical protein
MRGRIGLAIFLVVPALLLANALHSWTWFFAALITEVVLLCLIAAFGRNDKRNVTPQELADELAGCGKNQAGGLIPWPSW